MTNDCTEGAAVQDLVIWDNDLRKGLRAAEDDVTPFLAANLKAGFFKSSYALSPGYLWEFGHTARRSVSKRSGGTGRLSCCKAVT